MGVGVGVGKIQVDQQLRPGMIYQLPIITVLNTGDESSSYSVRITHRSNQEQLVPPAEWFSFSPQTFRLEPGEVQSVQATLSIPLKAEPGNYFNFLEGFPVIENNSGATNIGIAAATKLYFTIAPANMVLGAYYRAASFWRNYQPWTNRLAIALAIIFCLWTFGRYFKIQPKTVSKKEIKETSNEQ